jgi:hypothetical protein
VKPTSTFFVGEERSPHGGHWALVSQDQSVGAVEKGGLLEVLKNANEYGDQNVMVVMERVEELSTRAKFIISQITGRGGTVEVAPFPGPKDIARYAPLRTHPAYELMQSKLNPIILRHGLMEDVAPPRRSDVVVDQSEENE